MNITENNLAIFLIIIFVSILCIIVIIPLIGSAIIDKKYDGKKANQQSSNEQDYNVYLPSPTIKVLSQDKIEEIHSRGKITSTEYAKEWESTGTCIIISEDIAVQRCNRFRNCHDCIVDYANRKDEHTSIWKHLRPYNSDI